MILNQLVLHSQVDRLNHETDDDLPAPANLTEARQLLREAQKNVRDITKCAKDLQITFLEEQAKSLAGVNDEKAALICKQIVKAEEIKRMYMKLSRYLKPQGQSSMNHILVSDDGLAPRVTQVWRSVYDPVLLEALLQERNHKNFGQAHRMPFTQNILQQIPFSGT